LRLRRLRLRRLRLRRLRLRRFLARESTFETFSQQVRPVRVHVEGSRALDMEQVAGTDDQPPAIHKAAIEAAEHLASLPRHEIHQDVAAEDHVDGIQVVQECGIDVLGQIEVVEVHHFFDVREDLEGILSPCAEVCVCGRRGRVAEGPLAVDAVGGVLQKVEHHGDRVRFFACTAAGAPDLEAVVAPTAGAHQLGKNAFFQGGQGRLVAEEVGLSNGKIACQDLGLLSAQRRGDEPPGAGFRVFKAELAGR
jgi:hypothetical protein